VLTSTSRVPCGADGSQFTVSSTSSGLTGRAPSAQMTEGSSGPVVVAIFTTITIRVWTPTTNEVPTLESVPTSGSVSNIGQPPSSTSSRGQYMTQVPLYDEGASSGRLMNVATILAVVALFLAVAAFIAMVCILRSTRRRRDGSISAGASSAYTDRASQTASPRDRALSSTPPGSGEQAQAEAPSPPIDLDEWLLNRRGEHPDISMTSGLPATEPAADENPAQAEGVGRPSTAP
jgi:hypothetical protein